MSQNGEQQLVTVTIDGTPVQVPKGTLLVEAAKLIKREIPVYCYHTKMGPAGLCRICLVEVEGLPKLQIGCNTAAADGMVVHTQSSAAADGRRAVLEFYLKNHPLDCPICDKGGECDLQDYAMAYGQGYSRSADPKLRKPKAVDLGPTIVLDEERCVVCQRCVRFDDIIVGDRQLVLKDRGVRNIIATATGEPYRHNFTGNVTELCPVGALTSKTYRFKSRPWDLRRTTTTCSQCSVGCQMHVDVRLGTVMRTMSVDTDDAISDTWLCDRGRYNVGFYQSPERITQPLYNQDGAWIQIGWDDALDLWATAIREAVAANPASAGVIGGGRLTNEEAFVLQHLFREIGVNNVDWRAGRQRQATPGRSAGKLQDLENCDAIVIVGESPAERAPIMDLRIRKAAFARGARLIRLDSADAPYPPPIPSVEVPTVAELLRALPDGASLIAVVWDGVRLPLINSVLSSLPSEAAVHMYITGEQPNARGAEAMGMLPHLRPGYEPCANAGLDTSAMLAAAREGNLAVLSILGANPALQYPDGAFVRDALDRVPFLVVSDLFITETAQYARLLLPAKGPFEKDGTTMNATGDLLPVNAARALETPPGVLSDLEMLVGLAQRLGIELPRADEVESAVIRCAAAHAEFDAGDAAYARVRAPQAAAPEGGLTVVTQTRIFAGGGTSAHDDRLSELRPLPELCVGAADAQALGVDTGDYVDLTFEDLQGESHVVHDLLVNVRAGMPDGRIALIAGLPDDPANVFPEDATVRVANVRRGQAAVGASV
ncbi:MAG TPA: molybdopterin-dependent oxidoreductase [Candidatus Baltobacteraceae bacterium]|jgi:NADH-quinone oxidoreductase subunit G|nr:molybdopterin-dependent oxidoreductase [Candidatus Baltobacteraceae bacterium]